MYIFRQIQQVGPDRGEILSFVMAFGIHFQYLERRINLRPGYILIEPPWSTTAHFNLKENFLFVQNSKCSR